jgi:uncharacterized membrane protein (UPF0127 family)
MNPFRSMILGLRKSLSPRIPVSPEIRIRVKNQTRSTILATCMEVADSGPKRNKGLLGREGLSTGEGLWIIPCEAVHTFWMRFPIDLVYLDSKKRIRKLVSEVPPWRLSACLSAHSILELPAGTIKKTKTERGDILEFLALDIPTDDSVAAQR